ncbi:porin family protein [Marivirga salinae]|uniref:Porin family protein n=1 Tax=Marivirga salinarum TaxID=3059078 RepID=A0AA49GCP5_9BACT|nr:porin family protein [Marivirga sp. BDSF4-3]WKK78291.2 porin family protein [Marivirga sp. BDSF4-3]
MKKLFTLTALLFFIGISAKAQIFTIGPKIGVSSTTLSIKENADNYESGDARLSYHAGIFTRVKIAGFYIQPELYFNAVRGQYIDPNRPVSEPVEFNQNKIDMPVLFGWKLGPVRINAGPVASFNLKNLEDFEDADVEDYKTAVFAYQAGIGVDISKLIIDLKYEGNLSNQAVLGQDADVKVNQLMLSVGYKLL